MTRLLFALAALATLTLLVGCGPKEETADIASPSVEASAAAGTAPAAPAAPVPSNPAQESIPGQPRR